MFKKKNFIAPLAVILALTSLSTGASAAKNNSGSNNVERTAVIKSVQIGEQNISYKVRDSVGKAKNPDRTFLLIHGASANLLSTDSLAEELGRKFEKAQIVQIDLPAHGLSKGPVLSSVYDMADIVAKFVEQGRESGEFANRVVVAGISMGGALAQTLAVRNIEGLEKLVLISTSPEWKHFGFLSGYTGEEFNKMYPGMIEDDYAVNTTPEQQGEFHLWFPKLIPAEETSLGDIQALIGFNIVNDLNKITKKTLIIHGDADQSAPYANAELMASTIKKATLVTIPGETHTWSMKQPAKAAELIYNFVK
ncbi:alpha/beta fold hydrolase [Paenibacillus sp. FSL L8-0709]|uniref:alpha/beta fold hydrolase n=1 Tax=Paenibacillus sp. FSL L8-0709 TaxID=2975312 RepID=UPI0030F600E4